MLCEGYHSKSNHPNRRTYRRRLKWNTVQVSVGIWLMVWALITGRSVSSKQPRLCPITGKCWGIAKRHCPGVFMHETVACLLREERHCLRVARTHKLQLHTKHSRRDALWGRWGQWGLSGLLSDPAWMLGWQDRFLSLWKVNRRLTGPLSQSERSDLYNSRMHMALCF